METAKLEVLFCLLECRMLVLTRKEDLEADDDDDYKRLDEIFDELEEEADEDVRVPFCSWIFFINFDPNFPSIRLSNQTAINRMLPLTRRC